RDRRNGSNARRGAQDPAPQGWAHRDGLGITPRHVPGGGRDDGGRSYKFFGGSGRQDSRLLRSARARFLPTARRAERRNHRTRRRGRFQLSLIGSGHSGANKSERTYSDKKSQNLARIGKTEPASSN